MDTPNFLSTSLHIMSCVEVPVHIFGAYCILCKTPITMKSVKWSMLNLHFWSVFLDLTISILVIPYILFPAVVGRSLGLLEFVKVPQKLQLYLIVSLFPSELCSLCSFNRNTACFSGRSFDHYTSRKSVLSDVCTLPEMEIFSDSVPYQFISGVSVLLSTFLFNDSWARGSARGSFRGKWL